MFKLHYCIENFSVPKLDPCDKIALALEPNDTVDQQVGSNVLKPSSAILLNIFYFLLDRKGKNKEKWDRGHILKHSNAHKLVSINSHNLFCSINQNVYITRKVLFETTELPASPYLLKCT